MILAVGSKVKFKTTGDVGVVTALLGQGMVQVYLEADDMEIPAFEEDLVRPDETSAPHTPIKAKIIDLPKSQKSAPPPRPDIDTQYAILKSKGIQLAFDPEKNVEGLVEQYQIYLINATRFDVLFTFGMKTTGKHLPAVHGKLSSMNHHHLGTLLFDQLNDAPVITLDCWQLTTIGTGPQIRREVKIKAKSFFNKVATAPLLNRQVHLYHLIENFEAEEEKGEDLKSYTRRSVRPMQKTSTHRRVNTHDIQEFASFKTEIDLHVEKLSGYREKMNNTEKLRLQLSHFDAFLSKAITLGVERVFVIHGLGKGKLRNAIAERLIKNPEVITFKNEYHPRYGYGATEVILQK